jgi:uncharacterized protein (TIGR02145 family)
MANNHFEINFQISIKMKNILLYSILITFGFICNAQTIFDVDGNVYNMVNIGSQIWMKENLRTTKYTDHTDIPEVNDSASWSNLSTAGYCWYNGDATNYKSAFGALYNRYAVESEKLCPTGWHVPTDDEWITLTDYLGGDSVAGGKLKDTNTVYWINQNVAATNESGFTGLPGGIRLENGSFMGLGNYGTWICDVDNTFEYAWYRLVNSLERSIYGGYKYKEFGSGFSVRCIKNITSSSVDILNNSGDNLIYPNPARDKLYFKENYLGGYFIIFDLQGKQLISKSINSADIDISNLNKGIYLIKIFDSDNIISDIFIKE